MANPNFDIHSIVLEIFEPGDRYAPVDPCRGLLISAPIKALVLPDEFNPPGDSLLGIAPPDIG